MASGTPGGEGEATRNALFLQRCFGGRAMRWSDALIARTRRHIGGCLSSVEMALRLELGADFDARLPDAVCWPRVQADPALIDDALLADMRDRAAIGLMARDPMLADPAEHPATSPLPQAVADFVAALALAQSGWADAGPDDLPMRADLPAEAMPDLVWTVGALIADAAPAEDMQAIDQACVALLTRHDEQHMPFAQAALLAHRLHGVPNDADMLLTLARQRQVLALFAVMADRLGVDLRCLVRHVVEAEEMALFTLCRAAQFPREVAVRLVLGRRSVARGVGDSVLVDYADDYEGMTLKQARAAVAGLSLSAPLRTRLAAVSARRSPACGA
ncbi:hypothetical protein OOT33_05965 [Sphingobium sp. DEHP117]|uniref:hypothetical protein n=1 Tax=Sphingobium sp. DEHP117 TaxID=2993436 RepID=UPI0027D628E7|nr:hypothetical protein [Sphingobium sp. DEHP117]MDQ4419985.1 hypothetical protein [Sphingobium sp. DEHP117]